MTDSEKIAILVAALRTYSNPDAWCSQPRKYLGRGVQYLDCCGHCFMLDYATGRDAAHQALLQTGFETTEAVTVQVIHG